jgi:aryl-alcohol dehydrogenase-like predicted oxidoreductase/histidinol phosphatase-like enzyme/predicted kinase
MGCMRLSTSRERDPARAIAVIHAALDGGVRLLDTADAYCWNEDEAGHNERLVARALATWGGERKSVMVATKGGLTRPGGRWVSDGRAKHLIAACEASRAALGVEAIDLYQLHAPDVRTPLATSVRALRSLKREGKVRHIGLSNVSVAQIEEARRIVDIDSVQVELGCWRSDNFRNGVAEYCARNGILLMAYRPLGGPEARLRTESDPTLSEVAARHRTTPFEMALAWLRDLSPVIVPIPGPTRPETARSLGRLPDIALTDEERVRLDEGFPEGRLVRVPLAERRPPAGAEGEVVLVMGIPGAGKSTVAADLVAQDYHRLNRDAAGGRLRDLLPALERSLSSGRRRIVMDNTYTSRKARSDVVETAWRHGVPVRCIWVQASLPEAQVNAVQRMVSLYGRLLTPEEIKSVSKEDPNTFAPDVQFRYQRELEPPSPQEGFKAVEALPFLRRRNPSHTNRALILEYEGVLRRSRSGARSPLDPEDIETLPSRRETLLRYREEGYWLAGLTWQPGIAEGTTTKAEVERTLARTRELLALEIESLYCPHGGGPPVCWCRKPLPGLGVLLIEKYRLDPARCIHVGRSPADRSFAERLGFRYVDAEEFFR